MAGILKPRIVPADVIRQKAPFQPMPANMRQEHRGRKNARTIGHCIYCGARGSDVKLTEEHVIPYSLGADVYLKDASCLSCAEITKKFELHVARSIFGHHRIHKDVQTRHPEQRPTELPARVLVRGIEHRKNLSIADHPYFLAMPIWDQPGMLRGLKPSPEFDGLSAHLYYHIPDNIKETLQLSDGEVAEIRPESKGDANQFGRAIAKIAYCNAIATLGPDGFDPLELPDLILGKYPNVSFLVGSVLRLPPPPNREGPLHRIDIGDNWVRDPRTEITRRLLISNVRLFGTDGTAQNGMPIYTVVVGAPMAAKE
jgi:5-methylcytosine-specific restriction endonuclease McrA